MSLILRHEPSAAGVTLDSKGWVSIADLRKGIALNSDFSPSAADIQEIVDTNSKKRFEILNGKIRASQGHSIDIDLDLKEETPPNVLYHGTSIDSRDKIMETKIISKMNRHAIHLSKDRETAWAVGSRHGKPVILVIDSARMFADGFKFQISANGVWLSDSIPTQYVTDQLYSKE